MKERRNTGCNKMAKRRSGCASPGTYKKSFFVCVIYKLDVGSQPLIQSKERRSGV